MLTRRTTAKVSSGNEDRRVVKSRIIEDETMIGRAIAVKSPIVKQEFTVAGSFYTFEKLLWDDLVSINVWPVDRYRRTGESGKSLHHFQSLNFQFRTSTKCPAMAAAAAIEGLTRCVRPPRPCRPSKLRLLVDARRSPSRRV